MAAHPDPAGPLRYTLTHRPALDGRVDIVLDLFRGPARVLTRVVADVERGQAVLVMAKCRRYLGQRGVGVAPAPPSAPIPARPRRARVEPAAPAVAAFDWVFQAG